MKILLKPKNIIHKCHLWQIPCLSGSDKICCLLYPVTLDWLGGAPSTMVGDDNRGWAPLGGCGFIQIWESTSYTGSCQEKLRFRNVVRKKRDYVGKIPKWRTPSPPTVHQNWGDEGQFRFWHFSPFLWAEIASAIPECSIKSLFWLVKRPWTQNRLNLAKKERPISLGSERPRSVSKKCSVRLP